MASLASIPNDVSEEMKCQFLQNSANYTTQPKCITMIETHMSYVFLDDAFAYKLKKSLHNEYLDFSTVELRHYFCEEELRLNSRLAPDVYLSLVPLTINTFGALEFSGTGPVVDWLVKMRRLPAERMLDKMILMKQATQLDMVHIAECLVQFYKKLPPVAITCPSWLSKFQQEISRNEKILAQHPQRLPQTIVKWLCAEQQDALAHWAPWFERRLSSGRIVEGHGDLRPEHICLQPEPVIIDSLEFSAELRIVDIADEMSYLALECERLQAPELALALIENYQLLAEDRPPPALLHFYQGFRACVRARIAIHHLDEIKFSNDTKWQTRALQYLQLAEKHQLSIKSTMEPAL